MKIASRLRRSFFLLNALAVLGLAFHNVATAQEARIAASTLKIQPVKETKKIEVSLRLVDSPNITQVAATTGDPAKPVPAAWTSFGSDPLKKCAWMVVIDSSNPARQRTIAACVDEVRQFLGGVPAGDPVMLATMARDLNVVASFQATAADRETALKAVKADGDASLSTLIYQNLGTAITEHLAKRSEERKAVLLLTDGKDETPGGAEAVMLRRNELIKKAKELGIVVHTLGFAEKASEANWFADLKEVAQQTEGMHVAADTATHKLPAGTWGKLTGVMHGGGTALLDVAKLEKPAVVKLDIKTADGAHATVEIPADKVGQALGTQAEPARPGAAAGDKKEATEATESKSTVTEEKAAPAAAWMWWAIGGGVVVLLIVIWVMAQSRRKAAEEEQRAATLREAEQARILNEMLAAQNTQSVTVMAPPPPLAYLEMCDAEQTRHAITVPSLKIGRGQHNDLVLRNDSISGSHCVLQKDRTGGWSITDLKSGNGVLVNGKRVQQATLRPDDAIELGDIKMRFLSNA